MAESQYTAYCNQYGYPPSDASRLISFAKRHGVKVKFVDAREIIAAEGVQHKEYNIQPHNVKKKKEKKDNTQKPPVVQSAKMMNKKKEEQKKQDDKAKPSIKSTNNNQNRTELLSQMISKKKDASNNNQNQTKVDRRQILAQHIANKAPSVVKTKKKAPLAVAHSYGVDIQHPSQLIAQMLKKKDDNTKVVDVAEEIKPTIYQKKEIKKGVKWIKQWFIYDFKRYELKRIILNFAKGGVPKVVTLKMSDVAPHYSFKECETSKEWTLIGSKTSYQLDLTGDEYDAGFKRYILVEFNEYDNLFTNQSVAPESIQFFGLLSKRILDDDEQFQERFDGDNTEEKKDANAAYKPVVVDSSPTQQGMPLTNIWKEEDHLFWMAQYGSGDPWFIVDLGNNTVDEILVAGYFAYVFKTVKISSSDDAKSKKWNLLLKDDTMDTKMEKGGRYDLTPYNVAKYLKIELADSAQGMYTVSHLKLYGDSRFLTKEEKLLTMDEIKNMKHYDEDLINKYRKQRQKAFGVDLQGLTMKRLAVEQDPNKGKLCDEWIAHQKAYYKCMTEDAIQFTMIDAYTADTVFEEELTLKIADKQREVAAENAAAFLKFEVDWAKEEVELKKGDQSKYMDRMQQHSQEMQQLHTEKRNIINKLRTDHRAEQIYNVWKHAIMNNPRLLTSNYTVIEYAEAVKRHGQSKDEDGLREAYSAITKLFEQSLREKRDDLIHKFFVYQLNAAYGEHTTMLEFYSKLTPVIILMDVGDEKIKEIVIKCSLDCREITISTADEAKGTDDDGDGVWDQYIDGFDIIAQHKNDGVNNIKVEFKNKRYIKIEFNDWKDTKICVFRIDRVKLLNKNDKDVISAAKIIAANDADNKNNPIENILRAGFYQTNVVAENKRRRLEDKIRDEVCHGVNLLRKSRGKKISKHEKHFIKFLLCFQNKTHYDEMLYSAKLVMGLLRKPLDIEYKRLQSINSPILTLKLDTKYRCGKEIKSNRKLLEWDYLKWYEPRKALLWPQDLKPLSDEWQKLGLISNDPEFKRMQRKHSMAPDQLFVTSDDLAMEYLNLIAYKLDGSFQKTMKQLFKENRLKLGRLYPTGNNDLNVQSGPVKTKARQKIKVDLKYYLHSKPCCMSVLDIVRCGIVCQDDVELCSLFHLIMNTFNGNILRVKNAFDDIKKGDDSHGYRAVMININFGDESVLPSRYKMVCEAQLLLNKYYQIRKDMHLGYGICRSEDGGESENTAPHIVLARDCAKFGKLDI